MPDMPFLHSFRRCPYAIERASPLVALLAWLETMLKLELFKTVMSNTDPWVIGRTLLSSINRVSRQSLFDPSLF